MASLAIATVVHVRVDWQLWTLADIDVAKIRFGGLVIADLYIVMLLSERNPELEVLHALQIIRRDLAFGRIDVRTALRQTDIVLVGLRLPEYVETEMSDFFTAVTQLQKDNSSLVAKLDD